MLNSPLVKDAPASEPSVRSLTVAVLGLGYVGWPVATAYARAGVAVIGIDRDPARLSALDASPEGAGTADSGRSRAPGPITLTSDEHTYQVIGVDDRHNRCWVRRWPLARHGSPVFEISLQQVASNPHNHLPRKPIGA